MAAMSEKQGKPGGIGKTLKLFALIFVVLLVPVVMDQVDADRDTIKLVGRVAAGFTVLLLAYGVFSKLMKVLAFVVVAMIALVVLMSEEQIKAPRVKDWLASKSDSKSDK